MRLRSFYQPAAVALCLAPSALFAAHNPSLRQLEEIVVTAQKRTESINKVGLTIQAFSGEELAKLGNSSINQLSKRVPSLTYANSIYNTPVYTLRGVGFYENSLAAYPAISVYVDEVPLPFPVMAMQASLDTERVEVLKGPQGTLFGQNATGGAINYIAVKPTDEFTAGIDLSYSRFDQVETRLSASGALSNSVRARLATQSTTGGTWQKSQTRDQMLGEQQAMHARLLVDGSVGERLSWLVNLNHSVDKSDPQAGQYFALQPQLPVIGSQLASAPFAPMNPQAADWNPHRKPSGEDRQHQLAIRAEYQLNDTLALTSISSYIDFERRQSNDPDGIAGEGLEFIFNGTLRSLTQELRIANDDNNRLRWIIGGNTERSKSSEYATQYAGDSTVGSTLGFPSNTNNMYLDTQLKSYALFASADYALAERFTLKMGLRHTRTTRDAQTCTLDNGRGDGYVAAFFTNISTQVRQALDPSAAPTPAIPVGGCVTLSGSSFLPGNYGDSLDEDNLSWRAGVDFDISRNVLLYANIAKAYKAGSFLFTNASNDKQFKPVVQESIIDYEAGFKAQLLEHTMQLNGAIFYYDYANKQMRGKLDDPVFGVLDALVNVPKSSLRGAELSLNYLPSDQLSINLAASVIGSHINQYSGVKFNGGTENFKGSPIPFTPKLALNAAAEYNFDITDNLLGFIGAHISHNDSSYAVIGKSRDAKLNSYSIIDLYYSVETLDGRYRATLFANNVTNKYYYTNAPIIYDTQVRYSGQPAIYGLRISVRL